MAKRISHVILMFVIVWHTSVMTSAQGNYPAYPQAYQPNGFPQPQSPYPQYPLPSNNPTPNPDQIATNFPEFPPNMPIPSMPSDSIRGGQPFYPTTSTNPNFVNNANPVNNTYPSQPFNADLMQPNNSYTADSVHVGNLRPFNSTVYQSDPVNQVKQSYEGFTDTLESSGSQASNSYNSYNPPTEVDSSKTDYSSPQANDSETEMSQMSSGFKESCRNGVYLDDYCNDILTSVKMHFNYDLNLNSIVNDIFDPMVIKELQRCQNGTWCLPIAYHEDIKNSGLQFNDVYCKNISDWSMRSCLQKVRTQRPECSDVEVDLVFKSIGLLCDMWDVPFMELECYARTKKGLYVMYKQQLNEKVPDKLDLSGCNDYLIGTLMTYMCADDACHYDQQEILRNFGSWRDMAMDRDYFIDTCRINGSDCQGQDYGGDYYYDFGDYYSDEDEDYNSNYESTSSDVDELIQKIMNTVHTNPTDSEEEEEYGNHSTHVHSGDRVVFLGLIASVTIFTITFILLLVLGLRRYKTSQLGLPVYTKLATNEDISKAELS